MAASDLIRRIADLSWALLRARQFATRDSWPRKRILAYQHACFLRLVRHAQVFSPFYADLYRGIEIDETLNVTRLPVVTKRLLMEHFETVVTDRRLRRVGLERHLSVARGDETYLGHYRVVATAGTSGLRGIFVYDRDAWRTVLANTIRWQRLTGITPRLPNRVRICTIGADSPMHVTNRIPLSVNVGLFRLRHIAATEPISNQVAALNAFQPHALLPYPSIAALLAREQIAGRLTIRPEVVATHSELLTPEMSRLIEQAWGRIPYDHYGLTEEPHVGTDCSAHAGIHLFEDTCMVEVVNDEHQPLPDGVMGSRYLLTNLYNRTLPLIRYEVTDILCRAAERCECGRPFALLQGIVGRAEDLLRLQRTDGTGEVAVAPMLISLAIESFPTVHEYAAEHDAESIHIRLVVPNADERPRIVSELPERLRADIASGRSCTGDNALRRRGARSLGSTYGQAQRGRASPGRRGSRGCFVSAGWTIGSLLQDLGARGQAPAIIAFSERSIVTWDCTTVATKATGLAARLRARSLGRGVPVVLWAPNSPSWIVAALGVLAAGAVLVPVDDLAQGAQLEAVLGRSKSHLVLTTHRHQAESAKLLGQLEAESWLLDTVADERISPRSPDGAVAMLEPATTDPAALFWTSGTTGSPKAFFLTHGNIASNVEALRALAIVGPTDRALLPLPLHHAYPFIVGMLTTLTCGTTMVLPEGATGPLIMKALTEGEATAIIGVPRLYDSLVAAIQTRVEQHGVAFKLGWRGLLRFVIAVQHATGLQPGSLLFNPIRRAIAPHLRYLVSGGARLERDTTETLEALGWIVLSGYGLAETASIFTGNSLNSHRAGSAGKPLAGGQVRIALPDTEGVGEIELKGLSITGGYIDNPFANAETFTSDGWFRTGDLGYVDRDGFLFVTGRAKEVIVLGGGKKVNPEDLERVYGAAPEVREIAILEDSGALVALVRPDSVKLHARGAMNVRDGTRIVLAEAARDLPSYQRLSGFALTDRPLPRTRLGKYRRFLLHDLYTRALAGGPQRTARMLGEADMALLRDPIAGAAWALLRERFPDRAIDLDVDPSLDLNLDSFAWMELEVALESRTGVHLTEADIAGIETLRDFLRLCVARRAGYVGVEEAPALARDTRRWLAPTGLLLTAVGLVMYGLNWVVMHCCFQLRVDGLEHLPASGSYVITPNHVSDLDAMAIAAALPLSQARHVYWAGDIVRLFYSRLAQVFCRAVHLFPVDERYPDAAVATAAQVLQSGQVQVWFPEGWRSPDGNLQRFLPGIGQLLLRTGAPAVPAWVEGAFEALPRGRRIPRFHRVSLCFGPALNVEHLGKEGSGKTEDERIADGLRSRVVALGRTFRAVVEQVA